MSTPLYQCWSKATRAKGDQLQYGANWALARRARLKIYSDRLECGDWHVNYREIKSAVLYSIRSNLIIPGYVLKIETAERMYHFGLNSRKFWKGELPFPVSREKGKLRHSWLSLVARLVLLGYVFYLVAVKLFDR